MSPLNGERMNAQARTFTVAVDLPVIAHRVTDSRQSKSGVLQT